MAHMGKKRAKSTSQPLTRRIELRASEADYLVFSEMARRQHRSLGDWMRSVCREAVQSTRRTKR